MSTLIILMLVLFPVGILLKKISPNLCALCFATSGAWIVGLVGIYMGVDTIDILAVSILMGGSVVGSMYYFSSRVPQHYQLFKLPYIAMTFAFVYMILEREFVVLMIEGIGMLWLVFFALYWVRNNRNLKGIIRHVIECCKNW
jgi:hypothetical protein